MYRSATKPSVTRLFAALTVAALCALTACSSGSSASTSSSASTGGSAGTSGAAATSGSATPISIGSIGTFSGPLGADTSRLGEVIKAWASWTNAHGGIEGHPVKLTVFDDGGNATTAITDVKQLITQDKVVAIVSDMSFSDASWAPYAQQAGVPVIGGQTERAPFVTNPDFFSSAAGAAAESYGEMVLAKANGTKVATVYCAEDPVCRGAAQANQILGKGVGTSVAYSGFVAAAAPGYTATCQSIESSGAQSLVLGLASSTLISLVQSCQQQGVAARMILGGVTGTQAVVQSPVTKDFLDSDNVFPFFDDSTPATKAFQSAMAQYVPDLGDQRGPLPAYTWTAGQLFKAAVEASKATVVTPESVKAGLYALPAGTTLDGLAPPLTFTKGASRPTPVNCYFVWGSKNGQLYEPQGLKPSCAPLSTIESYNDGAYK
jgi:branched-chain amino acid transport system substrate-binding protein